MHFQVCLLVITRLPPTQHEPIFRFTAGAFTSARIVYVAGQEGYLPKMFGRLHSSQKTPVNALLLNMALTSVFILVGGGFRTLINVLSVAEWGFYFLTVSMAVFDGTSLARL